MGHESKMCSPIASSVVVRLWFLSLTSLSLWRAGEGYKKVIITSFRSHSSLGWCPQPIDISPSAVQWLVHGGAGVQAQCWDSKPEFPAGPCLLSQLLSQGDTVSMGDWNRILCKKNKKTPLFLLNILLFLYSSLMHPSNCPRFRSIFKPVNLATVGTREQGSRKQSFSLSPRHEQIKASEGHTHTNTHWHTHTKLAFRAG